MDTQAVLSRIHAEAQTASASARFVRVCRPGDQIRQGDVYVYRLHSRHLAFSQRWLLRFWEPDQGILGVSATQEALILWKWRGTRPPSILTCTRFTRARELAGLLGVRRPDGARQLAPGTSRGSRHVLEGPATIWEAPPDLRRAAEPELLGLFVLAEGRVTITHPEHAHVSIPAGWYMVTYQRDFTRSAAGTRAVLD